MACKRMPQCIFRTSVHSGLNCGAAWHANRLGAACLYAGTTKTRRGLAISPSLCMLMIAVMGTSSNDTLPSSTTRPTQHPQHSKLTLRHRRAACCTSLSVSSSCAATACCSCGAWASPRTPRTPASSASHSRSCARHRLLPRRPRRAWSPEPTSATVAGCAARLLAATAGSPLTSASVPFPSASPSPASSTGSSAAAPVWRPPGLAAAYWRNRGSQSQLWGSRTLLGTLARACRGGHGTLTALPPIGTAQTEPAALDCSLPGQLKEVHFFDKWPAPSLEAGMVTKTLALVLHNSMVPALGGSISAFDGWVSANGADRATASWC